MHKRVRLEVLLPAPDRKVAEETEESDEEDYAEPVRREIVEESLSGGDTDV